LNQARTSLIANGKAKQSSRETEILADFFGLPINGTTFECYRIIRAETEGPEITLS
jgi:hypothetical protein